MTPLEIFTLGKGLWSLYEQVDGYFGNKEPEQNNKNRNTNDSKTNQSWKYFKLDEFSCKCCSRNNISSDLVNRLDYSRSIAGVPFRITSGYRCKQYNWKIGGKPRSAHLDGLAVDIKCSTGALKSTIVASLYAGGINRIGIYKNFIHADISKKLPYPMLWLG